MSTSSALMFLYKNPNSEKMKYQILFFILIHVTTLSGQSKQSINVRFSGFIKSDVFFDTRQTVNSREGHFLLYPAPQKFDEFGKDLNAVNNFNILAIQTRLNTSFTGLEISGIKTSGMIEGEFFGHSNADINGFRLRHALIKWEYNKTGILLGQYWHPMFVPDVSSGSISFNTGVPFQPFSRNPQFRFTQSISIFNIIAAFLSQRDFSSPGPNGSSSSYLRNSAVPNLHLQLQLKTEKIIAGVGVDHKIIKPRTETVKGISTDESLGSMAAIGYLRFNLSKLNIKLFGCYGENLADMMMLGGYAIKSHDSTSGFESYTALKTYSTWGDFSYGKELSVGIFLGYTKNLGATNNIITQPYSNTLNIDNIYRVSPRVQLKRDDLSVAAELEFTCAGFGNADNMGIVKEPAATTNTRILFAAFYYFEL